MTSKVFILGIILIFIHHSAFSQTEEDTQNLKQASDLFSNGDYESAIIQYTKVIERSNYYDAYYGRGLCYYMLKKDTLALKDFYNSEVSLHHQADTNYFWFRGQSHHRLDQWEWALKNYRQAELNGMSLKGQLGLSLGTVCYFLGLTEEAHNYLIRYLSYNKGVEGAWTNLGWIYLEKEEFDSAEYAFERAYLLAKQSTEDSIILAKCLNNWGYAQGLNGKFEKGIYLIRYSIKLDPNNSFAYRNMGYLYMKKGDKVNACGNLKIALDMNIEEEWGRKYINELLILCK